MQNTFVPYSDDVETVKDDELDTIEKILESMRRLSDRTKEQYGHNLRVSHVKSHGLAVGELTVLDNLPVQLAQGLFARPASYPVIARLANVPGEFATDAVNTQRGFAFKVLDVVGEMLAGHDARTQDFVLDTGNRFRAADMKAFLMTHRMLEHAPQIADGVKAAISTVSHATNKVLHAVGADSANLDFFGHDRIHPLAEAYFSQAPLRYGDYIAKLAIVPVTVAQTNMMDIKLDGDKDPDALRTATVGYLRDNVAEFDVRVQLCTDLDQMPVENANKEWDEKDSPYIAVARLRLPQQEAYSEERREYVDSLSFSPAHTLAAHRPLGSIMRARLQVYPVMAHLRRLTNDQSLAEPTSVSDVPA